MKILVIGNGGREHALVWKLQQSPLAEKIYCCPGNPGMKDVVAVPAQPWEDLAEFAMREGIDLTMVGPEQPLCEGVVDIFRASGLCIVGPNQQAAQLEGSKSFAKDFMVKYGIPTAASEVFTNYKAAEEYIQKVGAPIVIKADGLAAGKGVFVAMTLEDALDGIKQCFSGTFGHAGARVVIEECLFGEEASILALTDGKTIIPLASSQDHKRLGEQDSGPNTGGMGAYSPAPVVTSELWQTIQTEVLDRFVAGVQAEGFDYRGIIYAGIMVTEKGPKVLEFNVRFGDPETQAVLARLDSDLVEALLRTAKCDLKDYQMSWKNQSSVCVVMASGGYPYQIEKGYPISGIEAAEECGAIVFHAGTKKVDNTVVNNGGRVLGVTALGDTVSDAVANVYRAVEKIHWQDVYYRKDIAHRAIGRIEG